MAEIRKFKKPIQFKKLVVITMAIAVTAGSAIGIFLHKDPSKWKNHHSQYTFHEDDIIVGIAHVIDGDTLVINGTTIRLFGIDAPEAKQNCFDEKSNSWQCGRKSTELLSSLAENKFIRCKPQDIDQYNRVVAICFIEKTDLNGLMVSNGLALAYRDFSIDYTDEEDEAKSLSKGLWRGKFEFPWNWRGINRYLTNEPSNNNCIIKGNINSRGMKIYHMPGDKYYAATQINPAKGEKWFCSKWEAWLAGWRRSKV